MNAALSASRRIPASVLGSLALHGGALGLYLHIAELSRQQASHVIGNVDLVVQVHKPSAQAAPKSAAPPQNMMNFLKMALPAIPKIEAQRLDVKVPMHEMKLATPKLEDRGKLAQPDKLKALDLDARKPEISALDVGQVQSKRSVTALASIPKLEEVGRRRVKNLPAAIKLEEEREQASAMIQMNALTTPTHHHVAPVGQALEEAAPAATNKFADKIASMLPTQPPPLEIKPEMRGVDETLKKDIVAGPSPRHTGSGEMMPGQKKGVELEGPIKDRKIASYEIPEFPSWARDQGVMEASVSIRFWVTPQGDVVDNMRVERTSGFGQLDRLAMDSLKNWKFVPLPNDERQWGVITFRFVLE